MKMMCGGDEQLETIANKIFKISETAKLQRFSFSMVTDPLKQIEARQPSDAFERIDG